jgi:hypothetical protein
MASLQIAHIGRLSTPLSLDQWHAVTLNVVASTFFVSVDKDLTQLTLTKDAATRGFVAIGSYRYGITDWDELRIERSAEFSDEDY